MSNSHATVTRDPDAQAEFRKRHGVLNADIPIGNAEALQRAHRASQSRAVQKASLLPVNNGATAELDLEELSGQLDGDEVHAAAVRGNAIVVVATDSRSGRSYKTVLPANDKYVPPVEEAEDAAANAASNAELAFQAQAAQLRAEMQAELDAFKEELFQQFAEKAQAAREDTLDKAQEDAEAAQKDAEEAQEQAQGKPDVETPAANDPSQGGGAKTDKSTSTKKEGGARK